VTIQRGHREGIADNTESESLTRESMSDRLDQAGQLVGEETDNSTDSRKTGETQAL
jgi:hypothetical protein